MPEPSHPNTLSPAAGRALCRLVRGVPAATADAGALAELEHAGLAATVATEECRDAAQWAELSRQAEELRGALLAMRPPSGLGALMPGAAGRFRSRTAEMQSQLDALSEEAREVERRYSAARRAAWPLLETAVPLPDGCRLLVTAEGLRAACAFWSSAASLPEPADLALALARGAERAASLMPALTVGWRLPPEEALTCGVLLSVATAGDPGEAASTLRTLREWLSGGKFWGQNPLPAALTLAVAPDPGAAARAAAEVAEALRARNFGVGADVFTTACRIAARPSWVAQETRVATLEWLVRRADDLGLMDQHRVLVVLAPLACLPRPVSELGEALAPLRHALRSRNPGGASTVETAAMILAGSGFYHEARQEGQPLLSPDDPAAQMLAHRYGALHGPLQEMDGPALGPGHRADILAAVAALLPGSTDSIVEVLTAARQALLAAGVSDDACRAPAALALALGACGGPLGIEPGDAVVELLTAQGMVQAAWAGGGPGSGVGPSFRGLEGG